MNLLFRSLSGRAPVATQTSTADDDLLKLDALNVERDGVALLRDISMSLRRGRTLGLVGESGAGKSMLGRVLARTVPGGFAVRADVLRFGGIDLPSASAASHRALLGQRIAFIPQEPMSALDPTLTIGRQFALHLDRLGVPSGERRQRSIDALAEVLLHDPEGILTRYPFQLSGGMCQRVCIAMAFASNPDLVISDEATTALDVTTQRHVVELMRAMQAKRRTSVLFVTHDLGLALHACDDIAVLYAGDLVEVGEARQIVDMPRHPYTRALLRANPPLKGERVRVDPLNGHMPGFEEMGAIAGCRFAARCAYVSEPCQAAPIPMQTVDGVAVRCVLGGTLPEAAPRATLAVPSTMADAPFLILRGVGKRYAPVGGGGGLGIKGGRGAGKAPVLALSPLDLSIAPGEFVGVVGESGSGKSTLGRLVMGLETPSEGSILLDGEQLDASREMWRKRIDAIQMVFQDARAALNPRRRLGSIVTQPMESRTHMHVDRARRALDLLDEVGLAPEMVARFPAQLSGGQRQRVNIARALCDVPRLLVADEIVSGLDVSVQAQIMELLLALRESHKIALMLISHDLAVVRYLCTRVVVMQRGVVVEAGPTEAVLNDPQHPYTRSLIDAAPHIGPARVAPSSSAPHSL
ncbi:ABC transporter ATP-binding protein [Paraburkholderia sp.]|uniref:ABC transporter ATP-binding protein n=1 Tax=Paraburkholderia sp. TaxID=1926495 RepID=UPI00239E5146|nr:ABC transporter ATP-binding protein [Paraburkholderia sp.]MDE1180015.1 ABC transporter ATP-binding protein [Paraburkholderia sp.]